MRELLDQISDLKAQLEAYRHREQMLHKLYHETRAKMEAGRRASIRGVPSFRIGGQEVACGAQSPDFWVATLRQYLRSQRG